MNSSDFENTAKSWDYAEKEAMSSENNQLSEIRRRSADAGFPQSSAAQAKFLNIQAQLINAKSIILIGTASLVEAEQLATALQGEGTLTIVDSTAKGADIIRNTFAKMHDKSRMTLRVVNTPVNQYLSKLNSHDYDMLVVAGDATNYAAAYANSANLLRNGGLLLITDALATRRNPQGGLTNPADRSEKAVTLRLLLENIRDDNNFDSVLVPVGTGLSISIKK